MKFNSEKFFITKKKRLITGDNSSFYKFLLNLAYHSYRQKIIAEMNHKNQIDFLSEYCSVTEKSEYFASMLIATLPHSAIGHQ